jgi:hypothetical protein
MSRIVFGGSLAVTVFGFVLNAQLPPVKLGPTPTESNFFIATPPGWVQPKTPWGDPDLQGIWPISYVGTVSLQSWAFEGIGYEFHKGQFAMSLWTPLPSFCY